MTMMVTVNLSARHLWPMSVWRGMSQQHECLTLSFVVLWCGVGPNIFHCSQQRDSAGEVYFGVKVLAGKEGKKQRGKGESKNHSWNLWPPVTHNWFSSSSHGLRSFTWHDFILKGEEMGARLVQMLASGKSPSKTPVIQRRLTNPFHSKKHLL